MCLKEDTVNHERKGEYKRMVVQHNLQAMNANRMLGITTKEASGSTEKLSSGIASTEQRMTQQDLQFPRK